MGNDDAQITDLVEPENPLQPVAREDLPPALQAAMDRAGWADLMPVQSRTIPYIREGRELMVQSRTGSGKTGAFVLPMLETLDVSLDACQALVLVPTRELANQVSRDALVLAGDSGFRVAALYGGVKYGPQLDALKRGAHIVVGTPGRVLDHLLRGTLSLDDIHYLVFDEADRMLSIGFFPDMKEVQRYLPNRQVLSQMFSATYPSQVFRLARQFMAKPEFLSLSRDHVHVTDVEHLYYHVPGMEKDRCLVRIIEMLNPASAIIFCNTKQQVEYVSTVLQRFGYDADMLTADLRQRARERVMARVREGKLRFLVATDLAARGIDIPELSHVIQYEPPEDPEIYVHRAGRTGRAGATGIAITLAAGLEQTSLRKIGQRFEIELKQQELPGDEDIARVVSERLIVLLEAQLRKRESLEVERMARFLPLSKQLAESEDEMSLIAMLLDEYYHRSLHARPDDAPQPEAPPTRRSTGGGARKDRPRSRSRGNSRGSGRS